MREASWCLTCLLQDVLLAAPAEKYESQVLEPGWPASAIGTPPAVAYVSARSISASGQNVSHSWEPKYIVMWNRQHS